MLDEEGLPQVFARHQRHAEATRAAVRGWGLEVLCARRARALRLADRGPAARRARRRRGPPGHPGARSTCRSAPGLGKLAGKVFRIGHLGHFNDLTLAGTLAGVQMGLQLAGVPIEPGRRRGRAGAPGAAVTRRRPERTDADVAGASCERRLERDARRRGRLRRLHAATCSPATPACTRSRPLGVVVPAARRRRRGRRRGWPPSSACRCSPAAPAPAWPGRPSAPAWCSTSPGTWTGSIELDPEARTARVEPRRGAGPAQPGRRTARADVRPGHLDQQPRHDRRDDRQQLRRQRLACATA